ncbi:hypothetical protein AO825_08430 [Pectobacterium brasiliense]|uniref:hypothetical protein n=1 Tax=Pectobacterium brasiliense TaxID=180957 RepID=UPI0001A444CF|nr:hypothetical protein [Pectobacterium brasiliense]KGA24937.1 hypothetical protein KS44_06415 [Pectobacterium brasiliense]KRF62877.1 hypothetical protein AO825_08430 [Pectobacterium brasiliense]MBN3186088.1 hypothetical protein [Pectobacterium brasiliense]QHG26918.1 hypothetical protein GT391_01975 [Pectobacterium brasiliense]
MGLAIAGAPIVRPKFDFDGIKSIQHSRKNILTGDSFKPAPSTPPPNKSLIQIIIDFLNRRLEP